jgi:hypothetical protein
MMERVGRLIAQILPLLGALALLPLMLAPEFNAWPLPWRLDALTIVVSLVIALGIAALPHREGDSWRSLTAAAILFPALLAEHLVILPIALLIVGALLRSVRFLIAGGALLIASSWLTVAGGARWSNELAAGLLTSPLFLLFLLATAAGLGLYPFSLIIERVDRARLALQPIWLVPLLRTIEWGPWNSGWAIAAVLIGGATALWSAASAVWTADNDSRIDQIARVWLGMALACAGLLTPVGIAAALWLLLAAVLSLGLLVSRTLWAAPLPPSMLFVATWLAIGATAASGAMLLAGAFFLATLLVAIAVARGQESGVRSRGIKEHPNTGTIQHLIPNTLVVLTIVGGILSPILLRSLIMPAVDQLQGGLTPFGLINVWPWVGLAALDAGQRRVAVLPSIAVAVLALVIAAIVWLSARWLARRAEAHESSGSIDWARLREQVWWARGLRRRG